MEEEVIEETPKAEPIVIMTKGKWQPFEVITKQALEVGKTYNIKIGGKCEFAISKDRPTAGIQTNEITYTKDNNNQLWVKTGE